MESQRCKVALHLLYVVFAEKLQVFDAAVLAVIHGDRPHLVKVAVEAAEVAFEVSRNGFTVGVKGAYAFLGAPNFIYGTLYGDRKSVV